MRTVGISLFALICGLTNVAHAGNNKVVVRTETYPVAGRNGAEIMTSMQRGGPTQGLQARAMAATRYDVQWNLDWAKGANTCRLRSANAVLTITYRFPRLANAVSPDVQARWTKFMAGVRTHEETHGRIAKEMVNAARASLAGIANDNDPGCAKSQNDVRRRVKAVYTQYEARQRQFDAKEHHYHGNVDGLVAGLMGS